MDVSQIEIVRPLAGGGGNATVDLVRAGGQLWVLKCHRPREVAAERLFQSSLREHGLPNLQVADCSGLRPDQLLMEYVSGSPTIGGSPSLNLCRRWGEAIRDLHGIRSSEFQTLDGQGMPVLASWQDFVAELIHKAIDRQRERETGLPAGLLDKAALGLAKLKKFNPPEFVLTHGDLHLNNALKRGGEVVLFDKPADVWVAPRVFDLCLIYSEAFPGALYDVNRQGDEARLSAFLEGYGDLPPEQPEWLELFVLLRSLRRYPSPFVPELRAVIEAALDRIARL
ncbi:MAG: aminoglycoside phosphotransferase family protein [Phenylobacterium sp.]|uniref:phosphotransferase enzyme family protein n=1 Tax=Phenylobacterium sp. TaxID=1871053 RepID=UPI002725F373|nr:aminoglycoside phosphotransferase family protein [Phenylobacterium sp.]MDO8410052.1 aminoglycoside phosphotransferase family protein [Phenylobacterium sp.]